MNSRLTNKTLFAFVIASLSLVSASHASAKDFECPWPHLENGAHSSEISKLLPTGDAYDDITKLNEAVYALRQSGVSSSVVVNSLIRNYCPVVAANNTLDDKQKTAKVGRFAGRITALVYSLDSATEIVLEVPLAPSIIEAITAKARAAGISPEDWVASVAAAEAQKVK
ncbi:hypothetical protein [Pseudochelatococcus sp. G4_1912]|uniref:hypothetical protein n=1 Tax=Pseudochelatococcus sp. G4_1912 TaxID=3114288 RepID=UPI0039C630D1